MKPKPSSSPTPVEGEENLLELEAKYCSWGDTVHYAKELTIFSRSEGSFLYD